ncbi:DoxX family membrane protein [Winogradskyella luteola]|uniref:DoxX family membrane protein n=1 Tax=Winogradskyella luteola TaxID=2828330 RepID=A0A9X1F5K9_9FLAO|nr:DoxX family membrane protein [Winogradskyella luteola]MBV7267767.1 DoxX family membrane protein [Winogradskyella luteola]
MSFLEKTHKKIYGKGVFIAFTWLTRILLAIAFMPSGFTKLVGNRFTSISVEDPVGFFFEAIYQTGWYWNFLGATQLLVALLLLIPRTSFLASLLYFPIIINIFLMVTSMHFTGTPIVAGLMLLGNIYLILWDYNKLKKSFLTFFKNLTQQLLFKIVNLWL